MQAALWGYMVWFESKQLLAPRRQTSQNAYHPVLKKPRLLFHSHLPSPPPSSTRPPQAPKAACPLSGQPAHGMDP